MKKHLKIQTFIQGLPDQQQKQNYRQYRILQEKKKVSILIRRHRKMKGWKNICRASLTVPRDSLLALTSAPHSVALLFITQPLFPGSLALWLCVVFGSPKNLSASTISSIVSNCPRDMAIDLLFYGAK